MDEHIQAARTEIKAFLDEQGRLKALPSKRKKALAAVYYVGSKLEAGREYTESEINDVIDDWTAYHDPATLRRELYNCGLLNRTADGRKYWLADEIPSYVDFMARHL